MWCGVGNTGTGLRDGGGGVWGGDILAPCLCEGDGKYGKEIRDASGDGLAGLRQGGGVSSRNRRPTSAVGWVSQESARLSCLALSMSARREGGSCPSTQSTHTNQPLVGSALGVLVGTIPWLSSSLAQYWTVVSGTSAAYSVPVVLP